MFLAYYKISPKIDAKHFLYTCRIVHRQRNYVFDVHIYTRKGTQGLSSIFKPGDSFKITKDNNLHDIGTLLITFRANIHV